LRINLDKEDPQKTTIKIRQCIGETKPFCDWGVPGKIERSVWPYNLKYLSNKQGNMNFFDGEFIKEGRCIDANEYYGRTELYPGWSCLLDMDCHSKKCQYGTCIGRI
jgi:hypothetical protein